MPGRPPRDVSKGSVHTKVDDILNHRRKDHAFDKRFAFYQDLAHWNLSYLDVLKTHADVSPEETNYLARYWYSPNGFWPTLHPVEPLVRQGLIKSIEEADGSNPPLPIDSYWLCIGGKDQDSQQLETDGALRFETIITRSPYQITRILLTPRPSYAAPLHLNRVPVWVVQGGGTTAVVGQGDEEGIVEGIEKRPEIVVVTTRLKTYP